MGAGRQRFEPANQQVNEAFQQAVGIDMCAPLPFTLQAWPHPLAVFLIMRRRTLPLNAVA